MEELEIIETPLHLWGIAIAVAVGLAISIFILLKIVKRLMNGNNLIVNILSKTHAWFIIILSLYFGSYFIHIPAEFVDWPFRILACSLALQGGFWARELVFFYLRRTKILGLEESVIASGSVAAINFVTNLVLWSIVAVFLLSNLGFNVTALLTGLGVGGIAVALAVQNILGDLFSSLSIVLDKPFKIGDMIIVDDHKGFVQNIGLKTTRLRSLHGEELVFSNSDLLKCRIRNFRKLKKRRAVFKTGITMQTPLDKIKKIPQIMQEVIEPLEKIEFERAHFTNIGAFAYEFETVYHVDNPDYGFFLTSQQEINFKLLERFEEEGIELAYPTSTVNLHKESS